jgi:hypothetical protein
LLFTAFFAKFFETFFYHPGMKPMQIFLPPFFLGLLTLMTPVYSLIGDWHSMTFLDEVSCLQSFNGHLYAGTSGGIRKINPNTLEEIVFNNPSRGILDVEITGMTVSLDGILWAVSNEGFIYRLEKSGDWTAIDRGFKNLGWKFNKRAILSAGKYIVLGSTYGLSFYLPGDDDEGNVEINLTAFEKEKDVSVTALLKKDSVLYIGTPQGIFRAVLYWDNVKDPPTSFANAHGSIFNPQIWEKVEVPSDAILDNTGSIGHMHMHDNSLKVYFEGSSMDAPFYARAVPGMPLHIDGKDYPSIAAMEVIAEANGNIFLGSSQGLYLLKNGAAVPLKNTLGLPPGRIAAVHGSELGLFTWNLNLDQIGTPSKVYRSADQGWNEIPNFIIPQYLEPIEARMQTFHVTAENEFFLGTWGFGIQHSLDGDTSSFNSDNTCLEGVTGSPAYVVVWSLAPYEDKGLFAGLFQLGDPLALAYLDLESLEVTCFKSSIISDKAKSPIKLKVVEGEFLLVSTETGLSVYRITNPNSPTGLSFIKHVTLENEKNQQIFAANLDKYGRLWAAGNGAVYYEDNFLDQSPRNDSLIPIDEFAGEECFYMEKDGEDNFWTGCRSGLIKIIPGSQKPVQSSIKYKNRDGLLDDEVINFHINKKTGEIWIVTDKGLNRFESSGRTLQSTLSSALVYPNPFKPEHSFVVFDNLTASSEVYIFNQSGNVIFTAGTNDIRGGQLRWYGTNQHGRRVKAGVYFYALKSDNGSVKGTIIVAR